MQVSFAAEEAATCNISDENEKKKIKKVIVKYTKWAILSEQKSSWSSKVWWSKSSENTGIRVRYSRLAHHLLKVDVVAADEDEVAT